MGAKHLSDLKPQFDKLGVKLVAIGVESFGMAQFIEGKYWLGDLYIDQNKQCYKCLNFPRKTILSGFGLLDKRVWAATKQAEKEGFPMNYKGDGLQLGGTIILGPGKTPKLVYYHKQEHFGDHPDPHSLLKICTDELTKRGSLKEVEVKEKTEKGSGSVSSEEDTSPSKKKKNPDSKPEFEKE
eukprot:TRINITY_DN920_c0_g1_i1.p1 TRINITY_DN920_c0_g1~~TRINITY_DN920_c0_g1_i1.p1  ORF type:complete len:183 (+),score=34.29 TRINITY_DN920_c0_g1_i1:162-710(+)